MVSSMVPMPRAQTECDPRPLIGCAWIGQRSLKSDSKGKIWQVAPVSIRKGREGGPKWKERRKEKGKDQRSLKRRDRLDEGN